MKSGPRLNIAILSGITSAIVAAVVLVFLRYATEQDSLNPLVYIVVIFPITTLINILVIERFLFDRVSNLYASFQRLKVGKKVGAPKEMKTDDMLDLMEEEVLEYAQDKAQEVEELKRLENYRRDFIGNVSHELKTPIFNVQGYLHTLLDGGMEDEKINRKYLKKSAKNLDRLESIVADLLLLSQYEANELKLEIEEFDIVELCQDVYEDLEMKADLKDISLIFKDNLVTPNGRATRKYMVMGDRKRINQVLYNLISNSIAYGSEEGQTSIRISDIDRNHLLIELKDNGPGIERRHLPHLFDRFYRVDKSRSRDSGGTGLGLAIVKHIIEAHDEHISVQSALGEGTTFSFSLRKA